METSKRCVKLLSLEMFELKKSPRYYQLLTCLHTTKIKSDLKPLNVTFMQKQYRTSSLSDCTFANFTAVAYMSY